MVMYANARNILEEEVINPLINKKKHTDRWFLLTFKNGIGFILFFLLIKNILNFLRGFRIVILCLEKLKCTALITYIITIKNNLG